MNNGNNNKQPLTSLNLTSSTVKTLQTQGFRYCEDLDGRNNTLPVETWKALTAVPTSRSALQILHDELSWQPVKTFIPELDCLLAQEITPGTITELCGSPGSGRTQICLHLAVGATGQVIFIHTNRNFSIARLEEIAEKYVCDAQPVLEKIRCIEASDLLELTASVNYIRNMLAGGNTIKLVIIDSISWPLKQQPFKERSSFIYNTCQNLRMLANQYKFPVVVSNDLITQISGDRSPTSSFGNGFYHLINTRVYLSQEENNMFKAEILKGRFGASRADVSFQF